MWGGGWRRGGPRARWRGRIPLVRRLARYTLNAVTILSLLLSVANVVLWERSFVTEDCWQRTRSVIGNPVSAVDLQMAWIHGGRVSIGTHHVFDGDPDGLV